MAVTERPFVISYSKNDIRYVFLLGDLSRVDLFLQIQVMTAPIGSDTFTALPTFSLQPDSAGNIYFYLQDYLDALLDYVLPDLENQVTNADAQAQQFYIQWREIDDSDLDPDWDTSEESFTCQVIKGGIEKYKQSRNNFFINYFATNLPFLTWMPSGRFVYLNDEVFLSFLNAYQVATSGFKLYATVTDTLGNITEIGAIVFTPAGEGSLYHINVSLSQFTLPALPAGAKFYYYEISINRYYPPGTIPPIGVNPVLASTYRFYIEYRPIYKSYKLVYHNSLGGVDFLQAIGQTDETIDRTFDEAEGGMNVNEWNSQAKAYETLYTGIQKRNHYTGDVGYQRTKDQQAALTEILMSTSIYQHLDQSWVPVINLQKSQDYGKNTDKVFSFPLEWGLSEQDEVFTPLALAFGIGDTSDVFCVPVALTASSLPDATVGTAYSQLIPLSGSAPFTLSEVVCPDWMTVAISGNNVALTGTPSDISRGGSTVSFRVTNCGAVVNFNESVTVDAATCIAVGIGEGTLPNGEAGVAYSYVLDLTGTAPFVLNTIVKPSWMTIAISGSTVVFSGTPTSEDGGTGIPVSFNVTNCSEDSAAFSQTITVTAIGISPSPSINRSTSPISGTITGPAGATITIAMTSGGSGTFDYDLTITDTPTTLGTGHTDNTATTDGFTFVMPGSGSCTYSETFTSSDSSSSGNFTAS